ncbi:glycoprotein A33 (transmembrane), paralog a isoform X1 [Anguilla anguilla]|uniref:glycoprotein A33 (transmembrane), paralog a isoform X1 n=2 Tax=Anguilla anguilla TaxID=7936 RepID=UPI0015A9DA4F|nr:glycoprotein A33 (transmembrane), paralog a isoform X1 [Anguilla anguilla]
MFGGCLILALVSAAAGLQVTTPKPLYEVARGDNVTLVCNFKPAKDQNPFVMVSWSILPETVGEKTSPVATYFSLPEETVDITPEFENRISMRTNLVSKTSELVITGVTMLENKVFECDVKIPGDDTGVLAATTQLVVLVAPSKPICKVEGKTEYGQDITLSCMSKEGSPVPTYTWKRFSVQNQPAPFPPKATEAKGLLSLFNVSMETSGFYVCTSANKIRSASCNMTLSVLPPSMNIGSTAGIIGGCVAALLLLAIIVYCCCCRKKKNEDKEYPMGTAEEAAYHEGELLKSEGGNQDDRPKSPGDSMGGDRSPRGGIVPDDRSEVRSERSYDRRNDYDDRREKYDPRDDDRRDRRDDRRDDYDDRRDRYDRRDRDPDRRDRDPDRRERYDDRRDDYDDRRDRYADRRDREPDRRDREPDPRDRESDRRDD